MSTTKTLDPPISFRTTLGSVIKVALIMALRVIGLFMVLPVIAPYAKQLAPHSGLLIGLAMGIYGLSQAALQIPFGILSDRYGRKPLILLGLVCFIAGSCLCAISHSIYLLLCGRFLQGAGAIGSVLIALIADTTPEYHLGKAMAVIGITMGSSFLIAFGVGPYLQHHYDVPTLFVFAAIFGTIALCILPTINAPTTHHRQHTVSLKEVRTILKNQRLLTINLGIFLQHGVLAASFVMIPFIVSQFNIGIWNYYICLLSGAFLLALPIIRLAENRGLFRELFLVAIGLTLVAQGVLWISPTHLWGFSIGLFCYFFAFSVLEAMLPALASRFAPKSDRGFALGLYSSSQFLGIFCGGTLGGLLIGANLNHWIFLLNACLAFAWLIGSQKLQFDR